MHHNIQDKNQSAEERNQDTQRFVRQVRSATRRKHTAEEKAQVLEKVEASPGSKGKVLAKLGPIATAIAGEQDREALRLEGFQVRLGTTDCADWLTMIENENGWSVIVVEFVCIWNYGVQIVIAAGKLGGQQGPIVIIGNHLAPFRNGFASFTRMFKTADNFG